MGSNHRYKCVTFTCRLIAAMFPHPNYSPGKLKFDIMVLKTVSPFSFTKEVKPIKLAAVNYDPKGTNTTYTKFNLALIV